MSSDNACIQRFGQTHFLFHFLCECIVTRSIIDLPVNTFGPVILGYFLISFDDIAVYIKFPPYVFHWFPGIGSAVCIHAILLYAYSYGGNTVADRAVFRCSRSWFIIIVHNIDTHAFSAIATVSGPVVEYVIPHIHVFAFLSKWTRPQTGYTTFVMCQQIMMKRSFCSSPDRSISMFAFSMTCCAKTFGNQAPLNSQILTTIYRTTFIYRPTNRAMVNDQIPAICTSKSVRLSTSFVAYTKTQIADYYIISIDSYRITGYTDTLSRRTLPGNG